MLRSALVLMILVHLPACDAESAKKWESASPRLDLSIRDLVKRCGLRESMYDQPLWDTVNGLDWRSKREFYVRACIQAEWHRLEAVQCIKRAEVSARMRRDDLADATESARDAHLRLEQTYRIVARGAYLSSFVDGDLVDHVLTPAEQSVVGAWAPRPGGGTGNPDRLELLSNASYRRTNGDVVKRGETDTKPLEGRWSRCGDMISLISPVNRDGTRDSEFLLVEANPDEGVTLRGRTARSWGPLLFRE